MVAELPLAFKLLDIFNHKPKSPQRIWEVSKQHTDKNMKIKIVENNSHQWDVVDIKTGNPVNAFSFLTVVKAADWADMEGFNETSAPTKYEN